MVIAIIIAILQIKKLKWRINNLPKVTQIVLGNGTPLQYSCQENPMDRGAW